MRQSRLAKRAAAIDPEAFAAMNTPNHSAMSARRLAAYELARAAMVRPLPTDAQRKALENVVAGRPPTHGLIGAHAWGGWAVTRVSLIKRGWLDRQLQITPRGRAAIGLPPDPGGSLAESADD